MKVIIADTSCLIIYHNINQLEILRKTFPDLRVTKEVAEEFGVVSSVRKVLDQIDNTNFRVSDSVRAAVLKAAGELA
jgi:predicted nucleic acid-binding protein